MNRIGGSNLSFIGSLDDAIGASFSLSSATLTDAGIGPTPDDPVIVTCGGLYLARRGS